MSRSVAIAVVGFVVMEPVTYASHRWVMHGVGWVWHRSHHRHRAVPVRWSQRVEANDWFPVIFAAVTVVAMAIGTVAHPLASLVPVAVGVTAYGVAYAFVHDLYIHGRLGRLPSLRPLEYLRHAHALHHRFGGEPYGMLCPIVSPALRRRDDARAAPDAAAPERTFTAG